MTTFDAYEILEIERDADSITVRRAYQRLARRYHPEFSTEDAAVRRFREVERAYRILADRELRRRHDAGQIPPSGRARGRGTDDRRARRAPGDSGPEGPLGPLDMVAEVILDFADAVRGSVASLSVQRERGCEECGGRGASGARDAGGGELPCGRCSGHGVVIDLERVRTRLPAGIADGARLRLRGRGRVPRAGSAVPPGDLYLVVRVRPHPYFERDGLDVHAELPVTYAEAALGAEIEVPTLDGPVLARLPAGTPGGQRFRLRERGIRDASGRVGDHYYRVRIVVPHRVDAEVRALIERLPADDPRAELPKKPL
jgi:molecular chaperone DnaJ